VESAEILDVLVYVLEGGSLVVDAHSLGVKVDPTIDLDTTRNGDDPLLCVLEDSRVVYLVHIPTLLDKGVASHNQTVAHLVFGMV